MLLPEIVQRVRSGVISIVFESGGQRVGSGSGFMSSGYLLTNNHVFVGPVGSEVIISHHPDPRSGPKELVRLPRAAFEAALVRGSDEGNHDFAVVDIPELRIPSVCDLELEPVSLLQIGEDLFFLGFPFEHKNLVCHRATVSSFFQSGAASIIQLDASVNHSNSGGPLVDPSSGKVVGIITRKSTGLSSMFDQLLLVLDSNVQVLKNSQAVIRVGGVDPIEMAIIGQNQMKALGKEILRSANVGIGYAFAIDQLASELSELPQFRTPATAHAG